MAQTVRCYTLFDCTATGLLNHHKQQSLPLQTLQGQTIATPEALTFARNQQRNWETLTQLISLRSQADIQQPPRLITDAAEILMVFKHSARRCWSFDFTSEFANVYDHAGTPLAALNSDCDAVPMLVNLTEDAVGEPYIITTGRRANTVFIYVNE